MFISKNKLKDYIEKIKDENRGSKLGQNYAHPISEAQQKTNIYAQGYEDGTDNFYNALCAKFKIKRRKAVRGDDVSENEIIKALECCSKDDCESCPLCDYDGCKSLLFDENIVVDLINRQKAEIERLNAEQDTAEGYAEALYNHAIKEFAERLKKQFKKDINDLVKEMIG